MKTATNAYPRWVILFFASIACIGIFYFRDAIYPLKETLVTQLAFNNYDFGFVVASYSLPSFFLAMGIISGILIDRFGPVINSVIFMVLLFLGSAVVLYSTTDAFNEGGVLYDSFDSFWDQCTPAVKLMALGLFIFGMGAESLFLVMTRVLIDWFRNRELALALGLIFTSGKIGESIGLSVTSYIQDNLGWKFALYVGVMVLILCVVMFIVTLFVYRKKRPEVIGEIQEEGKFSFKDIKMLLRNPLFLCLILMSITITASYDPFTSFGADWLKEEFSVNLQTSSTLLSVMLIITAILTPVLGYIVDKKNVAHSFLFFGLSLFFVVFVLMYINIPTPYLLMVLSGIGLSFIASSVYPIIAANVSPVVVGTAFGIIVSSENLGVWASSLTMGQLLEVFNHRTMTKNGMMDMMMLDYSAPEFLVVFLIGISIFVFLIFLALKRKKARQVAHLKSK